MDYLVAKWLHILSSTVLFGTGIGSAYNMLRACLAARRAGGRVSEVAMVIGHVVQADWLFTATSVIFQPLSGWYLAREAGYPLMASWLLWTYALYVLTGACWLPVVWIQIRMHDMAREAAVAGQPLPACFWRLFSVWVALGIPAFLALVVVFWLMVAKPA